MRDIPKKCLECDRSVTEFEQVHKGWMEFQYEPVTRCHDSKGMHYICGCVAAEVYCDKKGAE